MRPLGLNRGSYRGVRIDIAELLVELLGHARSQGWHEAILLPGTDRELYCLTRSAAPSPRSSPPRKFYLSAGIHGDEPAGPRAMLDLFQKDEWPRHADLWICPCLNPTGCARTTRENDSQIDLNRDYLNPTSIEIRAHLAWLEQQPAFDAAICLHEDWESTGFYCYELNPPGSDPLAEQVVAAVGEICPIETASVIDGRPTNAPGIIRPSIDPTSRPQWPEAFWLLNHGTPRSLTLEAPSDFPLPVRELALVTAVKTALNLLL
jgi:hypothetical protein